MNDFLTRNVSVNMIVYLLLNAFWITIGVRGVVLLIMQKKVQADSTKWLEKKYNYSSNVLRCHVMRGTYKDAPIFQLTMQQRKRFRWVIYAVPVVVILKDCWLSQGLEAPDHLKTKPVISIGETDVTEYWPPEHFNLGERVSELFKAYYERQRDVLKANRDAAKQLNALK